MNLAVIVVVGAIALLIVGVWLASKVIAYFNKAKVPRRDANYVTMCTYSGNGMRFQVRHRISELPIPDDDYEIPAFLRK